MVVVVASVVVTVVVVDVVVGASVVVVVAASVVVVVGASVVVVGAAVVVVAASVVVVVGASVVVVVVVVVVSAFTTIAPSSMRICDVISTPSADATKLNALSENVTGYVPSAQSSGTVKVRVITVAPSAAAAPPRGVENAYCLVVSLMLYCFVA